MLLRSIENIKVFGGWRGISVVAKRPSGRSHRPKILQPIYLDTETFAATSLRTTDSTIQ